MTQTLRRTALTLLVWGFSTGCSGGSSNDGGNGGLPQGALPEMLSIRTQSPSDQQTGVRTDATIVVQFDAELHPESVLDGRTYLEERDSGNRVVTSLSTENGGLALVMRPGAALAAETWYTVHLSPLLADRTERLLEEDLAFSFRTVDVTPPQLTGGTLSHGARDVPVDVDIRFDFDEPLDPDSVDPASVRLTDASGREHELSRRLVGASLHLQPLVDLLPRQTYSLRLEGLQDAEGNALQAPVQRTFETRDGTAPMILDIDPIGSEVSPKAEFHLTFDASMDLATALPSTIEFTTGGVPVPFSVEAGPRRRVLRLVPVAPLDSGRFYSIRIDGRQKHTLTSIAGMRLANARSATFRVGTDDAPPRLRVAAPANGASRVSVGVTPTLQFDEALDPAWLNSETLAIGHDGGAVPFALRSGPTSAHLVLAPTNSLEPGQRYRVTLRGGPFGVRDLAGNTLPADLSIEFHTTTDRTPPAMTISPTHGHSAVSPFSTYTAAFTEPLDPGSVDESTVVVVDAGNRVVAGTVTLTGERRIITFTPAAPYTPGQWYSVTLRDGAAGIRESSGNTLRYPVKTSFRIGFTEDATPPQVSVSLDGIADRRKEGLSVPGFGFEVTVDADDPINYDMDLGSFEVQVEGEGGAIQAAEILGNGRFTKAGLRYLVPLEMALPPGEYTLRARAADMAGNYGVATPLVFRVVEKDATVLPFERTQVTWVRFDLDRDHNGRADFEDDLYRLGLLTEGDPLGTNGRMIQIMREGILSQTHEIFLRKANGGRQPTGSIPAIFTAVQPRGVRYSQMAFGGLDPTGTPGREYGARSSGVLGRAYFDGLNSNRQDQNTGTNPGLGVFGSELFLFEVETHLSLYPVFITSFARRFLKLVPQMGGVPAGKHALDPTVLDPRFDPRQATPAQSQRYLEIMLAADDWAAAMGVILAHETGHSIGLVGVGAPPAGQHGDSSLHNHFPLLGDVMSSAVGYESLIKIRYRFRDLNTAYLRQRVLLK